MDPSSHSKEWREIKLAGNKCYLPAVADDESPLECKPAKKRAMCSARDLRWGSESGSARSCGGGGIPLPLAPTSSLPVLSLVSSCSGVSSGSTGSTIDASCLWFLESCKGISQVAGLHEVVAVMHKAETALNW